MFCKYVYYDFVDFYPSQLFAHLHLSMGAYYHIEEAALQASCESLPAICQICVFPFLPFLFIHILV
jgi:hypothetical protein